jgi:hypothetical protein
MRLIGKGFSSSANETVPVCATVPLGLAGTAMRGIEGLLDCAFSIGRSIIEHRREIASHAAAVKGRGPR